MKPVSEAPIGGRIGSEPSLLALLSRLDALASEPTFRVQREIALDRALRPYAEYSQKLGLHPLPEEMALAKLYLFADYFPEDGQLSLIEQIRDMIEAHVPEEERRWLDPLKHSFMDLLELTAIGERDSALTLRSLGDGREFRAAGGELSREVKVGEALLTRLIVLPDRAVLPGTAILLSERNARAILAAAHQWQRELEAESGSFDLGKWSEFTKRYGYVLLWLFAQARLDALLKAEATVNYRTPSGQPFLYAFALYEHCARQLLVDGLSKMKEWVRIEGKGQKVDEEVCMWVRGEPLQGSAGDIVARLTITPTQLIVECDSRDRLEGLKHLLTFGYSLHFRGESTAVPSHEVHEVNLREEVESSRTVVVQPDEEFRLIKAFLESVYLEWADRPAPALRGMTPRHAAVAPEMRARVAALIDQMERNDPALRRTGKRGYDYNVLRGHVGL